MLYIVEPTDPEAGFLNPPSPDLNPKFDVKKMTKIASFQDMEVLYNLPSCSKDKTIFKSVDKTLPRMMAKEGSARSTAVFEPYTLGVPPHPVIVTIRDTSNYIGDLVYSYYTTTGLGVHLT